MKEQILKKYHKQIKLSFCNPLVIVLTIYWAFQHSRLFPHGLCHLVPIMDFPVFLTEWIFKNNITFLDNASLLLQKLGSLLVNKFRECAVIIVANLAVNECSAICPYKWTWMAMLFDFSNLLKYNILFPFISCLLWTCLPLPGMALTLLKKQSLNNRSLGNRKTSQPFNPSFLLLFSLFIQQILNSLGARYMLDSGEIKFYVIATVKITDKQLL